MYICTRALVRLKGMSARLIQSTVNNTSLEELFENYSTCYLILTHHALQGEVSLALHEHPEIVRSVLPGVTVDQYLTANGNKTLPTSTEVPSLTSATVRYSEAFNAGFSIKAIHPTAGDGGYVNELEQTDLRLTKANYDYGDLFIHSLATVNGLLHITDYRSDGFRIKDAGKSINISNKTQIGLISFKNVGRVTSIPITENMISSRPGKLLSSGVVINLGMDISNKAVLISIGGYLHYNNHRYKVVGDSSIVIDWTSLPIAHRYAESRNLIDLSSVDAAIDIPNSHEGALDLTQMNDEAAIKAYMTLSQSFVILVDAKNLYVDRLPLEHTGLAGRYYCHTTPNWPMLLDNGRLAEYLAMKETSDIWVLSVEDNFTYKYHSDTAPNIDNYFHPARVSQRPKYYSHAYLLEIGTDLT